jgi:hypothetical protein
LIAQYVLPHCHLDRIYHARVLVELLLAFAFEVDFVGVAVLRLEADRGGDVEVVHEASDMEEHRVASLPMSVRTECLTDAAYLCDAEELHCRPSAVQHALLCLDLLKNKLLRQFVEVGGQLRPPPLLVFLCVALL